jgi:hypothetical protein
MVISGSLNYVWTNRGILIYEFWSLNPGETQDFKSIILHNLLTMFKEFKQIPET